MCVTYEHAGLARGMTDDFDEVIGGEFCAIYAHAAAIAGDLYKMINGSLHWFAPLSGREIVSVLYLRIRVPPNGK